MSPTLRHVVCPHCHTEMETTGAFCTECGARLNLPPSGAGTAAESGEAASTVTPPRGIPTPVPPTDASISSIPKTTPTPPVQPSPASHRDETTVLPPLAEKPALRLPGETVRGIELSPEGWIQTLTALGHYIGVLRSLNLKHEEEAATRTYTDLLQQIRDWMI